MGYNAAYGRDIGFYNFFLLVACNRFLFSYIFSSRPLLNPFLTRVSSASLAHPTPLFLFPTQMLADLSINDTTLPVLNSTIDQATELLQAHDMESGRSTGSARTNTAALQHLQSCLNLAFSTLDPIGSQAGAPPAHKGYRVHMHMEKTWGQEKLPAPTLSFWCFIPGMAFRMLRHLR